MNRGSKLLICLLSVLLPLVAPMAATAQTKSAASTTQPISDEERAAADKLMQEYLPEVKSLVDVLKKRAPKEYEKAIRDLAKSGRKLEATLKRDRKLFDVEVALLRVQVRVDTLAAQLQKADREQWRKELRTAVDERAQLRIARTERQRELAAARIGQMQDELTKLNQQLEQLQSQQTETSQREYDQLLRRAENLRNRQKSGES